MGKAASHAAEADPTEVIIALLNVKKRVKVSIYKSADLETEGFFRKPNTRDFNTYDFPVLNAVRCGDVEELERLRRTGISMNSCSVVRESILHLACRKGKTDVVRYLVKEVGVPINICDDYGRTPLHDAFWTSGEEPNIELIDVLLAKCPDLLFIKDSRGHTPLQYAPKEHWKPFLRHITRHLSRAKPKVL